MVANLIDEKGFQRDLENLFLKFGKPTLIKADNGPEFRIECSDHLKELSVYLLNSPQYYGQFNGAHERIHRTYKTFIDDFDKHHNLTRLLEETRSFEGQHNYSMVLDDLGGRTPADVYFNDKNYTPNNVEVVTPYQKDGELRMKFTDRDNKPARMTLPLSGLKPLLPWHYLPRSRRDEPVPSLK